MYKWIRGRLGRPIATLISGFMLLSLLLPMATPPAQAQNIDLSKFLDKEIKTPTPIIVFDFNNLSTYATGMLGRTLTDAVSIELMNTHTFETIKRQAVEEVMQEFQFNPPLPIYAQAMVADRLKCSYMMSGNIEDVQILQNSQGTYAQVSVSAMIYHRVTQLPINGAQVTVKSSPKIGFSGNRDVLVHEAITIAGYQLAQKILDNRLPIGVVLNTPREREVILKGGSTAGFHRGMICTTVRRETVTGRIRLTEVNPVESYGIVLEDSKGIAAGDKAVPIFEFVSSESTAKAHRERAGLMLTGIGMLGLLVSLVGTNNHNNSLNDSPPVPTVTAMSDAVYMDQQDGANLLQWPGAGSRVIAYLIYRDTNMQAPVAVVDGHTTFWVDSSTPLPNVGDVMETTEVDIELDPDKGTIDTFDYTTTYEQDMEELRNPDMTMAPENLTISCRRVPLSPGETCGYQIRILYMDYEASGLDQEGLEHPGQYSLFLGNRGGISQRITMTAPPVLTQPVESALPTDGIFKCERVKGALNYSLQVSIDPNFSTQFLLPLSGVTPNIQGELYVTAYYSLTDLYRELSAKLAQLNRPDITEEMPIYWRMGARVAGQPAPKALNDANQNGWVYSQTRVFLLPPVPPVLRSKSGGIGSRIKGPTIQTDGRGGILRGHRGH